MVIFIRGAKLLQVSEDDFIVPFVIVITFNTIFPCCRSKKFVNIPSRVLGLSNDFLGSPNFTSCSAAPGVVGSNAAPSAKFSLNTCITLEKSS